MPKFEVLQVSKSYRSSGKTVTALHEANLSIASGDVYGIIGFSGAGKSTLLRCMASLIVPTSGQIFFDGIDLCQMDPKQLKEYRLQIGMIFQHFNLLSSRTVYENIAYPLEIAGIPAAEQAARIEELLQLVNLSEKRDVYPSFLSGGEKQRVGIARALANRPKVLFCDEATSALDPKTTKEILRLLQKINAQLGVTIVLITHEMDVIKQICNQVAVMEKGAIVEKGAVADLFSEPTHPATKQFIRSASHEIPPEFIHAPTPNRKLLKLLFKGQAVGEPIISEIVKKFDVNANILLGWIDRLRTVSIGFLVVELTGSPQNIQDSLRYFAEKKVHYEVVEK